LKRQCFLKTSNIVMAAHACVCMYYKPLYLARIISLFPNALRRGRQTKLNQAVLD